MAELKESISSVLALRFASVLVQSAVPISPIFRGNEKQFEKLGVHVDSAAE